MSQLSLSLRTLIALDERPARPHPPIHVMQKHIERKLRTNDGAMLLASRTRGHQSVELTLRSGFQSGFISSRKRCSGTRW